MSQVKPDTLSPPPDEREPLLSNAERDPEEQLEDGESDDILVEKKATWWTWGWYAVGTVLTAVALGFFIKGFIDADDVEVRRLRTQLARS